MEFSNASDDNQSKTHKCPSWELFNNDESILQPIWMLALRYSDYVSSPLFPVAVGVISYFLCLIPFGILDFFGRRWNWVQNGKIQPDVAVSWSVVRDAMALTAWNQILYILPISVAQCIWTPPTPLPCRAPGLWEFIWNHYIALVLVDFMYYLWHVLHHHNRFLYRHVHSIHHRFSSLNCWVGQYMHPWELISMGTFATMAPRILGSHPLTIWSFMIFINFLSVEEHSGYDFPAPHHWIPFYGSSLKHDMHHQRPLTNLQPYFIWFDFLFGNHMPAQRNKISTKTANE